MSDSDVDSFLQALLKNQVLFFVGSGISQQYPACLPSADDLLRFSCDLFLPKQLSGQLLPSTDYTTVREEVVDLQPEVFYERLMTLVGPDALEPLSVLDTQAEPTLAHYLIVNFAAQTAAPIVTTNFDTLLEEAAKRLRLDARKVQPDEIPSQNDLHNPQAIPIWKVHGSIDERNEADQLLIKTTMAGITRPNTKVLGVLDQLLKEYHLCFIGYSGRDLDLFPLIKDFENTEDEFWIDPYPSSELKSRAERFGATLFKETLDDIIKKSHFSDKILARLGKDGVDPKKLTITDERREECNQTVEKLISEATTKIQSRIQVSTHTKRLFLGLCLDSIGWHRQAMTYLENQPPDFKEHLRDEDRIRFHLAMARSYDRVSNYVEMEKSASEARRAGESLLREEKTSERISLVVEALQAQAMGQKMQMGPMIQYDRADVDFNPPKTEVLKMFLIYIGHFIRMRWLLRYADPPLESVHANHAWYWYLDHSITLYAFIRAAGRAIKLHKLLGVFSKITNLALKWIRKQAYEVGDSMTLGSVGKYRHMDQVESEENIREEVLGTYDLITHPVNRALVHRNAGDQYLAKGEKKRAKEEFKKCLQIARECGNSATVLKALVGLHVATGDSIKKDELLKLRDEISGEGYTTYIDQLISRAC